MRKVADESDGMARGRAIRTLRDIRTVGSLRRAAPQARPGAGPAERVAPRPRAWIFVKQPQFARYQGALLVERMVEPEVDVLEQGQGVLVLAQLPGLEQQDIEVHVSGDILVLATKPTHSAGLRYYRELLLPFVVCEQGVEWTLRNGVLEVELTRAGPPETAGKEAS